MSGSTTTGEGKVSDPGTTIEEDELDRMVEKASTPSLADLFRQGKKSGLIQAGKEYGSTTA
jgi:hypothetical protein